MAARLWFMLKYFGHENVALLNGGLAQWMTEQREVEEGVKNNESGSFTGTPDHHMIVTTVEVKTLIGSNNHLLIDARAPERYRGEVEPIDTIAGHIPGAVNRFYGNNMDKNNLFLSAQTLRSEFLQLLNGIKPENAVVYCGSGPTSCHHLVAMAYAGLELPKHYVGSWSEWIRDPTNPIAKG